MHCAEDLELLTNFFSSLSCWFLISLYRGIFLHCRTMVVLVLLGNSHVLYCLCFFFIRRLLLSLFLVRIVDFTFIYGDIMLLSVAWGLIPMSFTKTWCQRRWTLWMLSVGLWLGLRLIYLMRVFAIGILAVIPISACYVLETLLLIMHLLVLYNYYH